MPVEAGPLFEWGDALVAYAAILIVAFLVTWVTTDLLHLARTPYVAALTVVTVALGVWYLEQSGTSLEDLVVPGWGWGVVGGVLAGIVVAPGLRRIAPQGRGEPSVGFFLWEGLVYGFAEAVLLATLPVLVTWQAAESLGWTDTAWASLASGALAIAASLLVIAVHHLGYREFRGVAARPKLMGALVGCGVQALAFLLTGNLLAPVIAHVLLHWQMGLRGIELPPATTAPVALNRPRPAHEAP